MEIQILLYDGFDELDVFGVFEPLKMAGLGARLIGLRKQEFIASANGVRVSVDQFFLVNSKPDILIVPGGGWLNRSALGAWKEKDNKELLDNLRSFHKDGVIIAAVCTGVMLLAVAGLLKDRSAITNHSAIDELGALGVKIQQARVVDDGDIITAGGITSSLDLGLYLIERFVSVEKAKEISERLEFEIRKPIWIRS